MSWSKSRPRLKLICGSRPRFRHGLRYRFRQKSRPRSIYTAFLSLRFSHFEIFPDSDTDQDLSPEQDSNSDPDPDPDQDQDSIPEPDTDKDPYPDPDSTPGLDLYLR